MPKTKTEVATPETTKPDVVTVEAIITQDGTRRQTVNVDDIVSDIAMLGRDASYTVVSAYLTQVRAVKDGRSTFIPVLWRTPTGALAVQRFISF
jgi:hypothetical protein